MKISRLSCYLCYLTGAVLAVLMLLGGPARAVELEEAGDDLYTGELDNGLKLILRENHTAPAIFFSVWYRVGSADEERDEKGLSHLLEHMLFKTTEKFEEGEIDRAYQEVGASWNGFTSEDNTTYLATVHKDFIDTELTVEKERFRNVKFIPEQHEKEMTVVRNEFERGEDSPFGVLSKHLSSTAFHRHPYQFPVVGWRHDVENVTTEEMRAYYDRYYWPNNAFIVSMGDFEAEQFAERLEEKFGDLPTKEIDRPRRTPEGKQEGERRVTVRRPGRSDRLMVGYHIPRVTHEDYASLQVLNQVLSSRASRLYENLVDEGIASNYFIYGTDVGNVDPSLMTVSTVPNPEVSLEELESTLFENLDWYAENEVSGDTLERAKKQFEIQRLKSRDSYWGDSLYLGGLEMSFGVENIDEYEQRIQEVTAEEVREVAEQYLDEDNRTVALYKTTGPAGGGGMAAPGSGMRGLKDGSSYREDGLAPMQFDPATDSPTAPPLTDSAGAAAQQSPGAEGSAGGGGSATTSFTTDNGIRVIVRENHSIPTFDVRMMLDAGAIYDFQGKRGTASLLSGLLDKGAGDMSKREIALRSEEIGADISSGAGYDFLNVSLSGVTEFLDPSFELLSKVVLEPELSEEELELLRRQRLRQKQSELDDTGHIASKQSRMKALGKDHPYSLPDDGTEESIQAVTQEDLTEFHETYFRPERTVVAVVGDVTPEQVREQLNAHFGEGWPQGGGEPETVEDLQTGEPDFEESSEHVEMPEKSQVAVVMQLPGLSQTSEDWYTAQVLNEILSGGFTGRLMKQLRVEKGYTYGSRGRFTGTRLPGTYQVYLGINPEFYDDATSLAKSILSDVASEGVTGDELDLAKQAIVGGLVTRQVSNGGVAATLANALALERPYAENYYDGYAERIRAVTLEDVNRLAERLFTNPAVTVSAGTLEGQDGEAVESGAGSTNEGDA